MTFGAHIFLWTDAWSDASLPLLGRTRELGLDCLEIAWGDEVSFDFSATRREAERVGLGLILSPGGVWPAECDLSLPDPQARRAAQAWHRRAVDVAAEIGAGAYTGAIYGHPGHVERRRPTPEEYARCAEELHRLAQYAAEREVRLVLEPMSHFRTHLVNTPAQVSHLLALSDHPNLGALLDTYHMVTEVRDYAEGVRQAGRWLWGVHACESDRGVPGGGLVPWGALAGALAEIDFCGYVGLESYNSGPGGLAQRRGLFGDPCPDGDVFVRQGLAFLRELLALQP